MKSCPKCGNRYSDDTLIYCLQDGTSLVFDMGVDVPTVVLGETESIVSRTSGDRFQIPIVDSNPQQYRQSQVTRFSTPQTKSGGSKVFMAVALTIVVMLVAFSVVGIGVFMFLRNARSEPNTNVNIAENVPPGSNESNYNSPLTASPSPTVASSLPSTTKPVPTSTIEVPPLPTTTDNLEQSRNEVAQRIYGWRSMLESRDLSGYMGNYADTVDYYRRKNASIGEVRADKARAFTLYNSMRTNISNMTVSVNASGQTAVAVFDKEWNFNGRDISTGKVRSQLTLRKINGRWLITSERDLKVYYTR
ncbi:MAG: hypothetical protein K1X36_09250 [Pyrinomonadaceae bacterium]|nr:hypothetical protein [Pyrinomonadaceae bacterium]